ncbi:MAG: DUF2293 domain-containing protein [Planctomycetota bacterium]|nr:DUF2293 domain-containing protein [Planctomycetota bacterium]
MSQTHEFKVFISHRDSTCSDCHEKLGRSAWITLADEGQAFCLSCSDLDHLAFLPSGNAALTRRSKKHSGLYAVVLQWSRARKHYERQGLLVEEAALAQAEAECLEDADVRSRQRERNRLRREELDEQYVARFAQRIREIFPSCPVNREHEIGEFACQKYSGRVGRSAAAKEFDEAAIRLAVIAHVRHRETDYDQLLSMGVDRDEARRSVRSRIDELLGEWRQNVD